MLGIAVSLGGALIALAFSSALGVVVMIAGIGLAVLSSRSDAAPWTVGEVLALVALTLLTVAVFALATSSPI